jgi:nicotinamide phosphoribosyltransferase
MPKNCKDIVVFGTQYVFQYIHELFEENFFKQDKESVCQEAKEYLSAYLGTDYEVSHFRDLHDLGYLPISVKALEEGTIVKAGIPLFTIKNTHTEFFWVTNFLETLISTLIWKPVHSASLAYGFKKILNKYAEETGVDPSFIPFQGHDFSFRGMQSPEAAISSGLGFLTSFSGTDTLPVLQAAKHFYNSENVGFSVPASEHSVMCSHGKEGEIDTLKYLMIVLFIKERTCSSTTRRFS